ncbi:DUF5681 domain-containing protein [Brevundimonas sanguinis]|uniref:DUF5681 domain-containing protein n=1 Tax=Brevundimonas sanguinis TaxID=3021811 RepID=UPI0024153134|nr:DUF5681 domain-containing protein [Brevundimonas sp. NCCP 15609]
MDDEIDLENLRRRRTAKGQFAKGYSGNPTGRPRTKHQRALSSRQARRDVLEVTEELIAVRSNGGSRLVPFHQANLQSIRMKALQGHAPSQRYLHKIHLEALREHEKANPRLDRLVEKAEANAVNKSVNGLKKWEWKDLNILRKFTWRL